MIRKIDFIVMARHILRKTQGHADGRMIHPVRDWILGLSLTFILFVLLSMYSGYKFYTISQQDNAVFSFESSTIQYNLKGVQSVTRVYGEREKRFQTLRSDRSNASVVPIQSNGGTGNAGDPEQISGEVLAN